MEKDEVKKINTREIGKEKESLAEKYLISEGYEILLKNFYTKIGEIDIIAYDKDRVLCFIEVKYRKTENFGLGLYAVDKNKQKRIYNSARIYMLMNNIKDNVPCRFDVVSILNDKVSLVKNAFP